MNPEKPTQEIYPGKCPCSCGGLVFSQPVPAKETSSQVSHHCCLGAQRCFQSSSSLLREKSSFCALVVCPWPKKEGDSLPLCKSSEVQWTRGKKRKQQTCSLSQRSVKHEDGCQGAKWRENLCSGKQFPKKQQEEDTPAPPHANMAANDSRNHKTSREIRQTYKKASISLCTLRPCIRL